MKETFFPESTFCVPAFQTKTHGCLEWNEFNRKCQFTLLNIMSDIASKKSFSSYNVFKIVFYQKK